MSTGIDIKYVKENYESMPDDKLIMIATQEANDLTPEAMEIVKYEIRKRGLSENIVKAVDAQNKTYTIEEIDAYCDIISNLSCPYCGNFSNKLNATVTFETISFLVLTHHKRSIKVGCPDCLDKANNNALLKSFFLGWWGFPWGLIRTPQAIVVNLKNKRKNHLGTHNDFFRAFALGRIGEIEANRSNKEQLLQILVRQNGA